MNVRSVPKMSKYTDCGLSYTWKRDTLQYVDRNLITNYTVFNVFGQLVARNGRHSTDYQFKWIPNDDNIKRKLAQLAECEVFYVFLLKSVRNSFSEIVFHILQL